ncbi:hypothetical protein [Paraherbaspirillum soli]|uniref:Uncharacterized protein n=1 Tax=Paraherbaspirillum soli TaxID=631222 RepID=A0ABW0M6L2_9BURK
MGGMKMQATQWLPQLSEQLAWEARRARNWFMRRCGLFGLVLLGCALLGVGAWQIKRQQVRALVNVHAQLLRMKNAQQQAPAALVESRNSDGRTRLKDFEDFLLVYEDIPEVVQSLLKLAEAEQLSITRGEYRPQVDQPGKFLRYRMTMPVKGDAHAIYRFMQNALHAQKALALESVQFKRERIDATVVEARIQWVVLTRLPAENGASQSNAAAGERR